MSASFKSYVKECMDGEDSLPAAPATPSALDFHDENVRDNFNFTLLDITDTPERVHPIIMFERVREELQEAGYSIPSATQYADQLDEEAWDESFVLLPDTFLYFAYTQNEKDDWEFLAEVVNSIELEDILSD